jgi:hypothetical protein
MIFPLQQIVPHGQVRWIQVALAACNPQFGSCFQHTPASCFFQDLSEYQPPVEAMRLSCEFRHLDRRGAANFNAPYGLPIPGSGVVQ